MQPPTDDGATGPVSTAASPPPRDEHQRDRGRPPLRRPREDRILAGVASGIADHLDVDVVIVRILIVVFAIVTEGLGVLAYIAAAVFVPSAEPHAPRAVRDRSAETSGDRDPLFWVGLGVLVLGAVWLARGTGLTFFPGLAAGQLFVPLVLIAFGLALWRAGDRRQLASGAGDGGPGAPVPPPWRATSGPVQPPGARPSPADPERPMNTDVTQPTATGGPGFPPPRDERGGTPPPPWSRPTGGGADWTPPPPPEPRTRSLLTRVTLGAALVTLGVLWSLRVAEVLTIGWGTILAASLLVIGLGLLVGSVVGRARWLILAGALIAPVVVVAQLGPLPLLADDWNVEGSSAGQLRATPGDVAELRDEYQLAAGSIHLDLTELDLTGEDLAVRADVGVGEIRVIAPDDVVVEATARSGIGQVRLFEVRDAGGIGAGEQTATFTPEGEPQGRIELELQSGIGEVRVETSPRATSDDAPEDTADDTSADAAVVR